MAACLHSHGCRGETDFNVEKVVCISMIKHGAEGSLGREALIFFIKGHQNMNLEVTLKQSCRECCLLACCYCTFDFLNVTLSRSCYCSATVGPPISVTSPPQTFPQASLVSAVLQFQFPPLR